MSGNTKNDTFIVPGARWYESISMNDRSTDVDYRTDKGYGTVQRVPMPFLHTVPVHEAQRHDVLRRRKSNIKKPRHSGSCFWTNDANAC